MRPVLTATLATAMTLGAVAPAIAQIAGSPFPAVRFQRVAQGVNSRLVQAETAVIRNANEWQRYFSRMAGDQTPGQTPAPMLTNFQTHDLLVVHTGRKMTAGFGVYISQVTNNERPGFTIVRFVDTRPAANVFLPQQITSPYVVTAVERQNNEYIFIGSFSITSFVPHPGVKSCGCPCSCATFAHHHNPNPHLVGSREILPPLTQSPLANNLPGRRTFPGPARAPLVGGGEILPPLPQTRSGNR